MKNEGLGLGVVLVVALVLIVVGVLSGGTDASIAAERKLTPPANGKIRVAFVLTDSATMIDFAGPWEVFQDVMIPAQGKQHDDTMPFELYTVSESRAPIKTSGGMTIVPDYSFDEVPVPKIVVVGAQRGSPKLGDWLRGIAASKDTDVLMSVCTGAFKLGDAGLLDGKRATTHHDFYDEFENRFPKVRLQKGLRFVQVDDTMFTAGGLTSGIDLALNIVERYFGREIAQQTATYMEYQGTGWKTTTTSSAATRQH